MKIHHIGIIVSNIEKSIVLYSKLGYIIKSNVVTDQIQNNKIAFMQSKDKSQTIELIEPIGKTSSIYNFNEGYHHICYEMEIGEDIYNFFDELRIGKIFTEPIQAPAINDRQCIFACLRNKTFVEFLL